MSTDMRKLDRRSAFVYHKTTHFASVYNNEVTDLKESRYPSVPGYKLVTATKYY
jgi:hypothetical protein